MRLQKHTGGKNKGLESVPLNVCCRRLEILLAYQNLSNCQTGKNIDIYNLSWTCSYSCLGDTLKNAQFLYFQALKISVTMSKRSHGCHGRGNCHSLLVPPTLSGVVWLSPALQIQMNVHVSAFACSPRTFWLYKWVFWYKFRFGPLDLEDLVLRNLVVHPDSFKLYCHLSVTILMQCPVIVSMLIRTRMSSICLQIGILLVCSWSLWGVSFNPGDLNARSKLRTPNSFKMVYFWCPIYTMGELKIQLLMIPLLNFSTLRPVSYDRKEEKHCLANSCFTCVSMS